MNEMKKMNVSQITNAFKENIMKLCHGLPLSLSNTFFQSVAKQKKIKLKKIRTKTI